MGIMRFCAWPQAVAAHSPSQPFIGDILWVAGRGSGLVPPIRR